MEARSKIHRHALYAHAPARIEYRIEIPEEAQLDVGLGVLREDAPVTFRITARPDGGQAETLLEETYTDQEHWAQHSVDLSSMAGTTVTLVLEAEAERPGTVALWAAPTLTGKRVSGKPNIIFYVIDGGGADFMSVYGYNRRTTPNLERIAGEGAVFEHAYSNSTWTKPSTASFMTSLHHSVLGGYKNDADPLPDQAVTMAQHLRRAGYQTAVIVSNPFAATMSGLDRGVDILREAGVKPNSVSSKELHEDFWRWREAYPGEPYWVHFQTTDVHWPHRPEAPFAGLFSSSELRKTYYEWDRKLRAGSGPFLTRFKKTGISREAYADAQRRLYDENMAHNDYQLGQLVERLKARGEWEHTLLIVAADHGYVAAGWRVLDPLAPSWAPHFNSHMTRVPLIMLWPERIVPGQRFSYPVSMIDVLPTILDLTGLPMPEVMQGQSLAPLLLGKEGWEPRPVILDEFNVDPLTGELRGLIEMIDGRWGASLEINPDPDEDDAPPERRRPVPLLLYDLWADPYCLHSLHEERPDLAEKYTQYLEAQWEAHQALAQHFTRSGETLLTPEQMETLRSLGYVQ
jgi:arylsulfatase A-like enzyme